MALIDELYAGPERKAALVGLLEQEAYLIASIDRHKLSADEENREKRVKNFLNKVCEAGLHYMHSINSSSYSLIALFSSEYQIKYFNYL